MREQHSDILTEQKCQRLQNRTGCRRTYRVRTGRQEKECFNRKVVEKFFDIDLLDTSGAEGDPTLCIGQSLDIFRRTAIRSYVRDYFQRYGSLRFAVVLNVVMERQFRHTETAERTAHIRSCYLDLDSMKDFNRIFNRHSAKIHEEFKNYTMNGSGWMIRNVTGAWVNMSSHRPLAGGGVGGRPIRLQVPAAIRNSACVVNPPGDNGQCFKYATLCAAFYQDMKANNKDPTKKTAYKDYLDKLDYTGINYPVGHNAERTFERFEANNPGYALNIMMLKTKEIHSSGRHRSATRVEGGKSKAFPIHTARMSPVINDPNRFPLYLLMLYNADGPEPLAHYTAVTKLNVFWEHARSTAASNKSLICLVCKARFTGLNRQRNYNQHFKYCKQEKTNHSNLVKTAAYRNLVNGTAAAAEEEKSICLNCHTCYVGGSQDSREKYLCEHTKACAAHPPAFVKMPSDPVLAFDKHRNQRPKPFRIYSVRILLLLLLLLLLLP